MEWIGDFEAILASIVYTWANCCIICRMLSCLHMHIDGLNLDLENLLIVTMQQCYWLHTYDKLAKVHCKCIDIDTLKYPNKVVVCDRRCSIVEIMCSTQSVIIILIVHDICGKNCLFLYY